MKSYYQKNTAKSKTNDKTYSRNTSKSKWGYGEKNKYKSRKESKKNRDSAAGD